MPTATFTPIDEARAEARLQVIAGTWEDWNGGQRMIALDHLARTHGLTQRQAGILFRNYQNAVTERADLLENITVAAADYVTARIDAENAIVDCVRSFIDGRDLAFTDWTSWSPTDVYND